MTNPSNALAPTTTRALAPEAGVSLMKDERVLIEGQPVREKLMRYFNVVSVLVCLLTVVGIPFLPLVWAVNRAFVKKHGYWVTDSRVIVTNGIIGFRTRSIPLERISDVAISSNWLEKWCGLQQVIVRDMTGEAMSGASMLAPVDATELQHKILDHVHEVNRRAPNKAKEPTLLDRPYRDNEGQTSEMMELLRRIEANTRQS